MSTVTAVPLPPVKKSALITLWIGLVALLAASGAYAWYTSRVPHIDMETVSPGQGPSPTDEDIVLIRYKGTLPDGRVFDEQPQAPMPVAGSVPGFSQALKRMQRGGQYKIVIPPELGYGDKAVGPIPANTPLHFDVTLIDFKSQAEVQAAQAMQQQMMQQQQMQQMQGAPDSRQRR